MSEFVLDCSAALPWVFANEATRATEALLDDLASGCDAAYLELTLRRGLPLASLDRGLRSACSKSGGRLLL